MLNAETSETEAEDRTITIEDKFSGRKLASGKKDADVFLFEGCWYFDRDGVDMAHLVKTEREYICPYKGTCYWLDLDTPEHQAKNIAWVYFDVKPGYEFIQDKIGFYAGVREATVEAS